MPFVAGIVLVTIWLHVRYGALSGLLFLFLATASPLLLDLSRQARGYGIAFLAMSVVVVAALELLRSSRTWAIVALCAGGVVGAWTLPHFTVAFLAIGAVLLAAGVTRSRLAVGLGVSIAAIAAWYAPHVDDILAARSRSTASSSRPAGSSRRRSIRPGARLLPPERRLPSPQSRLPDARGAVRDRPRSEPTASHLGAGAHARGSGCRDDPGVLGDGTHAAPRFFSFLLVPALRPGGHRRGCGARSTSRGPPSRRPLRS